MESKGRTTYIPVRSSAPDNPIEGDCYFDSTDSYLKQYRSGSWQKIGYLTQSDGDSRYVNVSGDTMTGDLDMNANKLNYVGQLKINNKATGNVSDVGNIVFTEDGQSSFWYIAKRGSGTSQPNRLIFSSYDGSSWTDHFALNPSDKTVLSRSIIPMVNDTYDLGTSSYRWKRLYVYSANFYHVYDQLRFYVSDYDTMFWMYKPSVDYAWAVYNATDTKYRAYLKESTGDMYIDGSYNTFSPHVGDDEAEIEAVLRAELEKPYVERDEKGRIICPVCRKVYGHLSEDEEDYEKKKEWVCGNPEHARMLEEEYSHDIGLIALASGKLLRKYKERIRKLEQENRELKSRLAKIEEKLGLA